MRRESFMVTPAYTTSRPKTMPNNESADLFGDPLRGDDAALLDAHLHDGATLVGDDRDLAVAVVLFVPPGILVPGTTAILLESPLVAPAVDDDLARVRKAHRGLSPGQRTQGFTLAIYERWPVAISTMGTWMPSSLNGRRRVSTARG